MAISRTSTLRSTYCTASIRVNLRTSNADVTTDDANLVVDHLMGAVAKAALETTKNLGVDIVHNGVGEGTGKHIATHSLTIDGTTVSVKVTLAVTRAIPSFVLIFTASGILSTVAPCATSLLDESVEKIEIVTEGAPPSNVISGLFGSDANALADSPEFRTGQYL